jgi:pimeloyl-ACP methyl ester carboxylesterase
MRIFFIHGFGEDEAIFSKIAAKIAGEHVFINVWKALGNDPRPTINVLDFAKELVHSHNISEKDAIIGHSMGGWIAYYIKHLTGSPIVQIGSWTHFDRVILPVSNPTLIYKLVQTGMFFNGLNKGLYTLIGYRDKPSKDIFRSVFDNLIQGNRENIINQLRLILTPVPEQVTVKPDLRIHALKDIVIRYPKEPFHEVVGDHFTLYTHPEQVYEPIVAFLTDVGLNRTRTL